MTALRWSWVGRLAFAGVLAGHCLAYTLPAGARSFHHPMSAGAGHSAGLVVASLVAASAAAGVVGFAAERRRAATPTTIVGPTAARLAGLQLTGFLGLELAERLLLSPGGLTDVASLATEPAVVVGLGLQLGIALVTAAVLGLIVEAVLRRRRTPAVRGRASPVRPRWSSLPRPRPWTGVGGRSTRGPPAPSIATA